MSTDTESVRALLDDWEAHLKARNRGDGTRALYRRHATAWLDWMDQQGRPTVLPTTLEAVKQARTDLEAYFGALLERVSASTVAGQYRSIQQLWKWLADEDEVPVSPMAKMRPPAIPEKPVPVFTDDELARMLEATSGTDFVSRRDSAILRVFLDTGCRLDEVAKLQLEGVHLQDNTLDVVGKGRRPRTVPFGDKTSDALRRYIRSRRQHKYADRPELWLAVKGPLTPSGIQQMLRRLARRAGIEGRVFPHRFRHTGAHGWLAAGGQETSLMRLMGWRSRQMVARYAASAADARAREEYKRLKPGDRV